MWLNSQSLTHGPYLGRSSQSLSHHSQSENIDDNDANNWILPCICMVGSYTSLSVCMWLAQKSLVKKSYLWNYSPHCLLKFHSTSSCIFLMNEISIISNHIFNRSLGDNLWRCDCGLLWLNDWILTWTDEKHTIQDPNDFLCVSPSSISGKSVMSLGTDQFMCGMYLLCINFNMVLSLGKATNQSKL